MSKTSCWDELWRLNRAIVGLSPMDGVTDAAMRYMTAKYGKPDVMFTEFVSVDALHYAEGERRERLLKTFVKARDLRESGTIERINGLTDKREHKKYPYEVAQVFGNKPELFAEAAELIESLGFDGIDINMGCPAKNV